LDFESTLASAAASLVLQIRQWLQSRVRTRTARIGGFAVIVVGATLACALLLGTLIFAIAYYHLPSIEALTDYRPKVPLRVWSADGVLLGEFGEERRSLVAIQEVPERLKQAILAAEDTNFYHHGGVDVLGIVRATLANLVSGHRAQGASTITMQVARNFFLSSERSYTRKVYEIALAVKIESSLSKDRILEVYINQIYLGQRAYGFASAAQVYFGKSLSDLTLGECAMLAELPKAPSTGNPLTNPKGARARQHYVLGRMLAINYIDRKAYDDAIAEDVHVRTDTSTVANTTHSRVRAEYVAELARELVSDVFHEEAYTRGLNVYTTISSGDQQLAYEALRAQVLAYDQRYGYRGPERQIDISGEPAQRDRRISDALAAAPDVTAFPAAIVLEAGARQVLESGFQLVGGGAQQNQIAGRAMHVGETGPALFPNVANRAQGLAGVEPCGGLVNAHGVEVSDLRELFPDIAVAADHAAAVSQNSNQATMFPVALLLLVGQFQLPKQVFGAVAGFAGCLDFPDETGPRAFLQLIQQFCFRLAVAF